MTYRIFLLPKIDVSLQKYVKQTNFTAVTHYVSRVPGSVWRRTLRDPLVRSAHTELDDRKYSEFSINEEPKTRQMVSAVHAHLVPPSEL